MILSYIGIREMGIRSNLEKNFDLDIVEEFLDHYAIMVDCMENMIIDLEKSDMFKRNISELSRVFHNISSSTSYLNITSISKLATFVNSVLEDIEQNYMKVNEETISWLLSINDLFIAWKNDFDEDNELSHIKYKHIKLPNLE